MIAQYVIVALAVLVSLAWLGRNLLSTWKSPGCATGTGSCGGCGHNQGGTCAAPDQRLVQLRRRR